MIHVLSEETINQIAAGEVIESPSCAIKELVENAIDANASRISVEIMGGGLQEIRVIDNGLGMGREDLLLCLERHATSKISSADDLHSVLSMGFRGEALSSIAAISKMTLITCQRDETYILYAEGGKIQSVEIGARNQGTTVLVNTLFYNVPPRQKFQKSPKACRNEIIKMLVKLALAHPFLELKCLSDGKEVFSSFGKRSDGKERAIKDVIEKVLGHSFLEGAMPIHFEEKPLALLGFIGPAHLERRTRSGQYLFVNGRPVRSPQISRAIYEGYGTRLSPHGHPTFVLHVTIDPTFVEVNVHPQKREIRLREERLIYQVIQRGVLSALQGGADPLSEKVSFHPSPSWSTHFETPFQIREEREEIPLEFPSFKLPIIGLYAHYLLLNGADLDPSLSIASRDGITLVDLQAAEARLSFEALLSRFEETRELQSLLFPPTLEFGAYERELVETHMETLKKIGIEIRPFGEGTFVIDAIDPHFDESELRSLVLELVEVLERCGDQEHIRKETEKKLALTALGFARSEKGGYTIEKARAITEELFKSKSPYQSPSGKPTCITLNRGDIEKYFH